MCIICNLRALCKTCPQAYSKHSIVSLECFDSWKAQHGHQWYEVQYQWSIVTFGYVVLVMTFPSCVKTMAMPWMNMAEVVEGKPFGVVGLDRCFLGTDCSSQDSLISTWIVDDSSFWRLAFWKRWGGSWPWWFCCNWICVTNNSSFPFLDAWEVSIVRRMCKNVRTSTLEVAVFCDVPWTPSI